MWFSRYIAIGGVLLLLHFVAPPQHARAQTLPLDEAIARQAYALGENWVRRTAVPAQAPAIEASDIAAVHVTIRLTGQTLGQATAMIPSEQLPTDNPVDKQRDLAVNLTPLLQSAVRDALKQTRGNLGKVEQLAAQAPHLLLDLQLARRPQRITLESFDQLPQQVIAGHHGLAMRRFEQWAFSFPATAIAANISVQGQVNRLLTQLRWSLDKLKQIGGRKGEPLYRFEAIHLVRPAENAQVLRLHRGNQVLPAQPMQTAAIQSLTLKLLDHLLHRQRNDGTFAGTYLPTADLYEPLAASDADASLAAFVLARCSRLPMLDEKTRQRADEACRKAVDKLVFDLKTNPNAEAGPIGLTLLAILETSSSADLKPRREALDPLLRAVSTPAHLFRATLAKDSKPAGAATQAVCLAAMTRLYAQTRDPITLAEAQATLSTLSQAVRPDQAYALLPWLVYAEGDLSRLLPQPTAQRATVAALLQGLWKRQLSPLVAQVVIAPSPDTIGGFGLPTSPGGEPTWQSASLLAAQAVALRSGPLIAADQRGQWIINLAMGMRFLQQLSMQGPSLYYARNSSEAEGGIRLAIWDNKMPLDATAMALLAAAEFLHELKP